MPEITYLMGSDSPTGFYGRAKKYFVARHPGADAAANPIVDAPANGQTLEDVFADLRRRAAAGASGVFDTINLVSHATQFATLQFGLTTAKRGGLTSAAELNNAVAALGTTAPAPAALGSPAVTRATHVRLYGCDFGKNEAALRNLGLLFGTPADVSAPLRAAVFRERNGVPQHRLARTWSVAWPTDIEQTAAASWPAVRTQFVTKAMAKFGPIATTRNPSAPGAADALKANLTTLVATATATSPTTRFFDEGWGVAIPNPPPADLEAKIAALPGKTGAAITAAEISDLTVVAQLTPADLVDRSKPGVRMAHLAVLAEVIDVEVSVTDPSQYKIVTIAPPLAPGGPPAPVPVDAGAPAPDAGAPAHSLWQQATDAFVAAGGAASTLDDLIAGLSDPVSDSTLDEPDLPVPAVSSADEIALVREADT